MGTNGVFCLEGDWEEDLRDRGSVLPILELLEHLGRIKAIHRRVASADDVSRLLTRWDHRRYNDYQVLYFACHGDKGKVCWSSDEASSLDELAELIGDRAAGCYIYFGSCLTLFNERDVERFISSTRADAVLGYRREVDWLESAAFEVILLAWMANHTGRPGTLFRQLMAKHGDLARLLKFVVGTKDGVLRAQDVAR